MDTPLRSSSVPAVKRTHVDASPSLPEDGRQRKKHKMDAATPVNGDDFCRAVELVINDQSLPAHLKAAMGGILDIRMQLNAVIKRNEELIEENAIVRAKNCELEKEVQMLRSQIAMLKQTLPSQIVPSSSSVDASTSTPFIHVTDDDAERKRSIVIVGVRESSAPISSDRVLHDANCVRQILDFLAVDCRPIAIYRMGRFISGRARLLKVVFPASFFATLSLKRAPYLRYFSVKGVYIRPSLSSAERDRLKAQRLSRTKSMRPLEVDCNRKTIDASLTSNIDSASGVQNHLSPSHPHSSSPFASHPNTSPPFAVQSENI